jgi:prepilin-type N-terminal cleavage/methylation domain-containing protein/prepilin-type processing-associated H-X9-DG protein
MKKKFCGFSLVELLTVMAVIAALTAILVPALGTARQIAHRLVCLNNLKQLGITALVYTQAAKVYPVCVPEVNETWEYFLANPDSAKTQLLGVPVELWQRHENAKLYNCPQLVRRGCDISYCYNWQAGREFIGEPAITPSGPSDITPPTPSGKTDFYLLPPEVVKSPKIFILLYDLPILSIPDVNNYNPYKDIDPDDYKFYKDDPNANLPGYLQFGSSSMVGPHTKGYNILFSDGHVKWHKWWDETAMSRNPSRAPR